MRLDIAATTSQTEPVFVPDSAIENASSSATRVSAIDGLRGIAALGVVAFHLRPTYIFWMWAMVALFFVISGFVITRLLLETPRLSATALRNFWIRRTLRIWPVYYVTLLGAILLASVLHRLGLAGIPYNEELWKFFFFVQFTDLYDPARPLTETSFLRFFLPSWSLAVEEQFYLVWPLVIALLRRHPRAVGALCVGVLCMGPISRMEGLVPLILLPRVDGLAVGSLLAVIAVFGRRDDGMPRSLLGIPAAAYGAAVMAVAGALLVAPFLATGYERLDAEAMFFSAQTAPAICGFALLFGALVVAVTWFPQGPVAAVTSHPLLVYLGSISFAVYMFHEPLRGLYFTSLGVLGVGRSLILDAAYVGAVIGAAHLSRQWLERPMNRLKDRFPM